MKKCDWIIGLIDGQKLKVISSAALPLQRFHFSLSPKCGVAYAPYYRYLSKTQTALGLYLGILLSM